jgi:hypothetical protein
MRVVRVLLRVAVVSCTMVLAYAVPKLSLIIALFGAVFGGMIELILPPMLFLCDSNNPKTSTEVVLNRGLLIVGVGAVVGGAIQATVSIVESL